MNVPMFAIFLDMAAAGSTSCGNCCGIIAIFGSFTSTVFLRHGDGGGVPLHREGAPRWNKCAAPCRSEVLPACHRPEARSRLEPRLEETLESFFRQDYPDFEIIFGARSRDNQALTVVERLRKRYPNVRTRVVISGEPSWPNAKVFRWPR